MGERGLSPERLEWLNARQTEDEEEEEKEAEAGGYGGWNQDVGNGGNFDPDFTSIGVQGQHFTPTGRRQSHVFGISGPTAHLSVQDDQIPTSPIFSEEDDEEAERRRVKEKKYCGLGLWLYITVAVLVIIIIVIVLLVIKAPEREVACNTNPGSPQCESAKKQTFLTIFISIVVALSLLCIIQCSRWCGGEPERDTKTARNKVAIAWEQQEREARERDMRLAHTALYVQEVEAQEQEEAWEASMGPSEVEEEDEYGEDASDQYSIGDGLDNGLDNNSFIQSPSTVQIFNLSPQELAGKSDEELVALQAQLAALEAGGSSETGGAEGHSIKNGSRGLNQELPLPRELQWVGTHDKLKTDSFNS
jgi:hypothetical protein